MRRRFAIAASIALAIAVLWYALAPFGFASWRQPLADTPAQHGLRFETIEFQALQQRHAAARVAVIGHSMGGQTALYAAARDARLEAVVSDSMLQRAYPRAELWITSTPDAQLPDALRNAWGTHCHWYSLHPDAYVARVTAFLDRTFAAREAG